MRIFKKPCFRRFAGVARWVDLEMIEPYNYFNSLHLYSALISFIPGLINLGIFGYVFFRLPQKPLNLVFSLFVFFLFVFQMSDTFMRLSFNEEAARNCQLSMGSWISINIALGVHLSLLFYKRVKMHSWIYFIIYFPAVLFTTMHMIGYSEVVFIEDSVWGFMPVLLHSVYNNVFAVWISAMGLFMLSTMIYFVIVARKKVSGNLEFKQGMLITIGISIPIIQGIVTEVLFPLVFDINPVPLTSASITTFSICAFIAITHYKLLSYSPEEVSSDILNRMNEGILILDNDDVIQFANHKIDMIAGYSSEELIGKNLFSFFSEEEKSVMKKSGKTVKELIDSQHQIRIKSKEKREGYCWLEAVFVPYVQEETISGYILILTDITAKKNIENKLSETRQELDFSGVILNNINNYVLAANSKGDIIYVSNSILTELGYGKHEILGRGWYSIMRPEESSGTESSPEYVQERANGMNVLFPTYETWIIDKKGHRRCILWQDTKSNGDTLIGIGTDITMRKRMENEILNAVSETQENERKRIARELHDGLVQVLTGISINLNVVKSRTEMKDEYFNIAQQLLDQAIIDARSLSHDLMPVELGECGLTGAIDKIKDRIGISGDIKMHFDKPSARIKLSEFLEVNLYRIVQEFLNNTIKYAEAKNVHISLFRKQKRLWMVLKDDGKGFDATQKTHEGIGLQNIKARAKVINGELSIQSYPGKGVLMSVHLPI